MKLNYINNLNRTERYRIGDILKRLSVKYENVIKDVPIDGKGVRRMKVTHITKDHIQEALDKIGDIKGVNLNTVEMYNYLKKLLKDIENET